MTNDLKRKLNSLTNEALNEQAQIESMEAFQSVISMVDTLVQQGRVEQLRRAIHIHFPEYFTIAPPSLFCEN